MCVFAYIIFANLCILSHSTSLHSISNELAIHHYNCNTSYPCNDISFHIKTSHHINILCNQINSCNNLSIIPSPHISNHKCTIYCQNSHSCNNIHQLQSHCSCHGHCTNILSNRRLLDVSFIESDDYIYLLIILGLVLICGICLCILCCKWYHERQINRNMSRERRQYNEEEQRSLSGKHQPQLITDNSNTHTLQRNSKDFNHNFVPNQQINNTLNIIKQKNMNLSPESVPLSDPNRATSPMFSLNTTPSPE
eukprot:384369_1